MYNFLALLPIAFLLVISLLKGVKTGIYTALVVTCVLFFIWDSAWSAFPASFIAAFVDTVSILMIVFGAIFLYHTMEDKGYIDGIQSSLQDIHTEKNFRFYFLAFFLTAFFESVAGFGTPGAIVPLLLVTMGYSAVMSISTVLLIDGLFAVSGAIGTPVTIGLAAPLDLSVASTKDIYLFASIIVAIAGFVIFFFVQRFLQKEHPSDKGRGMLLYLSIMVPFAGLSFFLQELTGLIAAVILAIVSYMFFFTNKKVKWGPWLPYALLVFILLIPKIIPAFARLLDFEFSFQYILNTEVSASLKPLRSPFLPFIFTTLFAAFVAKDFTFNLKPVISKTMAVFLVLFPSLAITRLMLSSGTIMPSMVEALAGVFVGAGEAYPFLSPFIGVLGVFITGSTTVSNVIFGPVQYNAAQHLLIREEYILAMQLVGASLGNAICLFNIIAAAAVAGVENYSAILKKNILPVVLATVVVGIVGYLMICFL